NALMLLPSLLFSVSSLIGPFVMKPSDGKTLGRWACVPKLLGWIAATFFYVLVSWLIAREGWLERLGLTVLAAPFVLAACRGVRFISYRRRLTILRNKLWRLLVVNGLASRHAERLAQQIMREAKGGMEKVQELLNQPAFPTGQREPILTLAEHEIRPLLQKP